MGMSAWGIFAAPFLANAPAPAADEAPLLAPTETQQVQEGDIFSAFAPMDENAMSAASGGAETAIDIDDYGVNFASNDGVVNGVSSENSETGQISGNVVSDNGGITTVFNNTGNGVIFQSNVNVNIFLNEGGGL